MAENRRTDTRQTAQTREQEADARRALQTLEQERNADREARAREQEARSEANAAEAEEQSRLEMGRKTLIFAQSCRRDPALWAKIQSRAAEIANAAGGGGHG